MTREPVIVYQYLSSNLPDVVVDTLNELVNRLIETNDSCKEILTGTLEFLGIVCSLAQNHNSILESDITDGDLLLQYLLSTFRPENINEFIIIDAPTRSIIGTQRKISQMKVSKIALSQIDHLINRTKSFLEMNNFSKAQINIILRRIKTSLTYFSILTAISNKRNIISIDDIEQAYLLMRKFMFKLTPMHVKLVKDMFEIQNPQIIQKISQISLGAEVNYQISKSVLVDISFEQNTALQKLGVSKSFIGSALKMFSQINAIKENQSKITTLLIKKYEVLFVEYLASIYSNYFPLQNNDISIEELKIFLSKIKLDNGSIKALIGLQRLLNYSRTLIKRSDAILKMSNIVHRIVSLCIVISLIIMNAKGSPFITLDIIHLSLSHVVDLLTSIL